MHVELRRGTAADLGDLLPLVAAYHEFEGIGSSDKQRRESLSFLLRDQDFGAVWCISHDDELAGYIALCKGYSIEFGGFDAFIDEFYLAAEFRSKGIGGEALNAIKAEALKLDINALHLEVARDNTRARRLYAAHGFEAREKYLLMSAELEQA